MQLQPVGVSVCVPMNRNSTENNKIAKCGAMSIMTVSGRDDFGGTVRCDVVCWQAACTFAGSTGC